VREESASAVSSLLRTLREQVEKLDREPRLGHVGSLQGMVDAASRVSGSLDLQPQLDPMLATLRRQVADLPGEVLFRDVGTVQRVGDGVATLSGLPQARTDELVTFPTGVRGMVLNLDHAHVDVILLGEDEGIQGGDLVTGTGHQLVVPVGRKLLGRVVSALGEPLDERGTVREDEFRHVERDAPGIRERAPVRTALRTGIKVVDALVPIGRGQRELIIGDRQIGKTTLALDAILSQKDEGVLCVYVAIGQKKSSSLSVIDTLRNYGALAYTTVVVSSPDDPPALRYLAPYAGCAMAEFLMDAGHDVLIVYDDLSKHADAYRELSLLLRRPPGREAYPGDIFYLHARLLERACKLGRERGGGSLTALPIVETQNGRISAYIPSNLIAITDGQIVLDSQLFNRGVKPPVHVGLSVSRVGGAAQPAAMRSLAANLRLEMAQFDEVSRFARFGTEVDEATQLQIRRGERVRAVLSQVPHQPLSLPAQVVTLLAGVEGVLDAVALPDIPAVERELWSCVQEKAPDAWDEINRSGELSTDVRDALRTVLNGFRTASSQRRDVL